MPDYDAVRAKAQKCLASLSEAHGAIVAVDASGRSTVVICEIPPNLSDIVSVAFDHSAFYNSEDVQSFYVRRED